MKQQGDLSVPSPVGTCVVFRAARWRLRLNSLQGVLRHGDCVEWIFVFSGVPKSWFSCSEEKETLVIHTGHPFQQPIVLGRAVMPRIIRASALRLFMPHPAVMSAQGIRGTLATTWAMLWDWAQKVEVATTRVRTELGSELGLECLQMQMTPPWGKKGTEEPLDESERGKWKSWLKTQHSKD